MLILEPVFDWLLLIWHHWASMFKFGRLSKIKHSPLDKGFDPTNVPK